MANDFQKNNTSTALDIREIDLYATMHVTVRWSLILYAYPWIQAK